MENFVNKYPYTDFHELNLDWIIKTVKDVVAEWAATLLEWHNTQEEWQQLYDYVHDYFDNLDVQQEINNKLDQMALDGSLASVAQPIIDAKVASLLPGEVADQIGPVVADQIDNSVASQIGDVVASQISTAIVSPVETWLNAHITQPTTPAIDNTLSIIGAAADAAAAGAAISTCETRLDNEIVNMSDQLYYNHNYLSYDYIHQRLNSSTGMPSTGDNAFATTNDYIRMLKPATTLSIFGQENITNYNATYVYFYDDNNYISPAVMTDHTVDVPATATRFKYSITISSGTIDFNDITNYCKVYTDAVETTKNYIDELLYRTDFDYEAGLSYTPDSIYSLVTHDFFSTTGVGYAVLDATHITSLVIDKAYYNYPATRPIIYFNGIPSSATEMGTDGNPVDTTHGFKTVTNFTCTIPEGCQYIIVEGYYDSDGNLPSVTINSTLKQYAAINDAKVQSLYNAIGQTMSYSLNDNVISMTSGYDTGSLVLSLGLRGVNQLPDITNISANGTTLFTGGTDSSTMPYIIKAVNNIDGDQPNSGYFTGGNHGYDNTGTILGNTATARNVKLEFYADGKLLSDGDSGICNNIEILCVNRIQAYNTTKSDGTGREVLEEGRRYIYDGKQLTVNGWFKPLENVIITTYYGVGINVVYVPTIQYIGANNRIAFNYTSHLASGNNTPNMVKCHDNDNMIEIEVDRSFDLGRNPLIGSENGMFCSGSKVYANLVKNTSITSDTMYSFRAFYRFYPV